jgi:hypothetical protein
VPGVPAGGRPVSGDHARVTDEPYDWRHGWVPLTMRAALQKTRGNHERAARLLAEARARRRRRRGGRVDFVTPHPRHAFRALSDDELAETMGAADDETLGRIVAELDRRDAAQRKARERRAAARTERDEQRSRDFDAACEAGEDPEAAYARLWGVSEEKVRRDEAAASLRSSGYTGRSFAELVRSAHRDHTELSYWQAEDETRGVLLNKAGQAAGVHPRSLFTGPESRARKYASEELMAYWHRVGRPTSDDFAASLLGGAMRSTGAWA